MRIPQASSVASHADHPWNGPNTVAAALDPAHSSPDLTHSSQRSTVGGTDTFLSSPIPFGNFQQNWAKHSAMPAINASDPDSYDGWTSPMNLQLRSPPSRLLTPDMANLHGSATVKGGAASHSVRQGRSLQPHTVMTLPRSDSFVTELQQQQQAVLDPLACVCACHMTGQAYLHCYKCLQMEHFCVCDYRHRQIMVCCNCHLAA